MVGLVTLMLGLLYAAYILYARISGQFDVPGWTGTMMAILILGGVQLLFLGLIAEYMGRIYEEVKRRPLYVVGERVGFEPRPKGPDESPPESTVSTSVGEPAESRQPGSP